MEHPEERYYKLNRFLLSATGLWPYQSEWSARLFRTVITILMTSCVAAQISSLFTYPHIDLNFISELLPMIVPTAGNLFQIYTRVIYIDKFKELFELMWNDWALEKTDDEIKIMHQYAETAKSISIYYFVIFYSIVIGYIVWLFMPVISAHIQPTNESLLQSVIHVEFYIDTEQHIYFILFYLSTVFILMPLIFIASSTLFLVFAQHVCSMCELLGCKNIVLLIQQHYNVIKFVDMIETSHTIPFLIDLSGVVSSISLCLLKILNYDLNFESIDSEFVLSFAFIIVVAIYLIIPNYGGQKITDKSSILCEKVYNSAWYNADVSQQKSLMLIMGRRFHPLVLTACKFYPMSLSSIKMIFQMAISYCMFMRKV
ncbi:Odorant receptor 319 [Nylanderia fulva]|uniref:Odorant receptor n=1 Tax=Nylanderia fulva TaxID=613905 RepID=A0A6G1LR48_9HYME|nr:Odorant receptor 319 [Nylanderia fulva]